MDRPEAAQVLLALDYPGRRQEARVLDLRLEAAGFDVRYLLAPPFVRQLTAPAYAAELIARNGPFERAPAGVLAYCMAAPIAQEVAARCAAGGDPVPLVLFDGEPATARAIQEQYQASLRQLRAQLGVADARAAPVGFDGASLASHPGACVDRMRRSLVELGVLALGQDADPDADRDADRDEQAEELQQIAGQLADFYVDWLVHLVAAYNASWPRWGGDVLHVASRRHHVTGEWPGARTTTERRVAADRNDLLRHPQARDLVLAFLDRARPAVPATPGEGRAPG